MRDGVKIYAKNSNIVARKIVDEMVLVPIRQSVGDLASIYTLNEVGARIWELIDGGISLEQVRDKLVAEYEVMSERVEADLSEFITQLEQIGAVSLVTP